MAIARNFQNLSLGGVPYTSALKQGTGWNPIHAIRDTEGRNIAPDGTAVLVDPNLPAATTYDEYGYTQEDCSWMSPADTGQETGMYDRPTWQEDSVDSRREVTPMWPSWGPGPNGVPKGTAVRAEEHGAIAGNTPNQIPNETVSEGWLNKATDGVNEPGSGISDPDQYVIQTSMRQLRRTRAGSQRGRGSASPYDAPIETRVPGQKVLVYSGGERHYDMAPKSQDLIIRPFWYRNAGTGIKGWLQPNAMYVSEPLNRDAPGDPYQGPTVPSSQDSSDYGWTSEDVPY